MNVTASPRLPRSHHCLPTPWTMSPSEREDQIRCSMRTIASYRAVAANAQQFCEPLWFRDARDPAAEPVAPVDARGARRHTPIRLGLWLDQQGLGCVHDAVGREKPALAPARGEERIRRRLLLQVRVELFCGVDRANPRHVPGSAPPPCPPRGGLGADPPVLHHSGTVQGWPIALSRRRSSPIVAGALDLSKSVIIASRSVGYRSSWLSRHAGASSPNLLTRPPV